MTNGKVIYMVYTPPRLTTFRNLPRDVVYQIVSPCNRYARGRLKFILLVIGMINQPNFFQQSLYNTNKTSGKKLERRNDFNIQTKTLLILTNK